MHVVFPAEDGIRAAHEVLEFRRVLFRSPRWTVFAEGEYVERLFNANYNSTTIGNTAFPVVADPDATELNQAYVSYADAGFKATAGRQRLIFDNHRFIGNVGWRQNEQTFDALDLTYKLAGSGPSPDRKSKRLNSSH